jgi:hypothetical protein
MVVDIPQFFRTNAADSHRVMHWDVCGQMGSIMINLGTVRLAFFTQTFSFHCEVSNKIRSLFFDHSQ